MVTHSLVRCSLVLEAPGSIPTQGERFSWSEHVPLTAMTGLDVNWSVPLQGDTSPLQVKDPTTMTKSLLCGPS